MVHNPENEVKAILYRKRGFSYREIAELCNVPKSTLHTWFRDASFSKHVTVQNIARARAENSKRLTLLNKAKLTAMQKQKQQSIKTARTLYKNYTHQPLFIAGLTLCYVQDVTSSNGVIRLSTKDMEKHRLFLRFAKQFLGCEEAKIRFWLLLHDTHNKKQCEQFWQNSLKKTAVAWHKTQVLPKNSASTTLPLHFGVGNTIIADTFFHTVLTEWIQLLKKNVIK